MEATRKLYRSRTDRKLAGVCGGLAEYFGRTDTTVVRVAFVVLALLGGAGARSTWRCGSSCPSRSRTCRRDEHAARVTCDWTRRRPGAVPAP